ncbi:MAG: TOBE domain-containing protein, partial [Halobacteria archaeon]|nr:TOBE domain-containing protein [Halobacteria archaeon]
RILKDAGVTAVSVTHDQEEALSISDRIAVMNSGTVVQVGQPQEVFEQPESRFVADFLGNASFISGHVTSTGVETPIGEISLELVEGLTPDYEGAEVEILIRPDDATVVPVDGPENAEGEVVYRQYDGPNFVYRVELENGEVVRCMHNHTDDFELGTPVSISLEIDHSLAWYPSE